MIASFNAWFRDRMLQPDGRVVWWEHMVAWVPLPTAVGILLGARQQSLVPLCACTIAGVVMGYYSFRQDQEATRIRQSSMLAKPQTPSAVPKYVSAVAIVFLILLAVDVMKIMQMR